MSDDIQTHSYMDEGVDDAGQSIPLPTPAQWLVIAQLLSDLATTYHTPYDSATDGLTDLTNLGSDAHDLCVTLGIPYGDPEVDWEETDEEDV